MKYNYFELLEAAKQLNASAEDRKDLFMWFEHNFYRSWNGDSYPLENGERLYPVFEEKYDTDGELVDVILVDAVIR